MIKRVMDRFGLYPEHLAGDSAYGAAEMVGWLVEERGIEPHVAAAQNLRKLAKLRPKREPTAALA